MSYTEEVAETNRRFERVEDFMRKIHGELRSLKEIVLHQNGRIASLEADILDAKSVTDDIQFLKEGVEAGKTTGESVRAMARDRSRALATIVWFLERFAAPIIVAISLYLFGTK